MRFAPGKTEGHQAILTHHHTRDRLVRQMTQVVDAIRSPLAEFEIVGPAGVQNVNGLLKAAAERPAQASDAVDLLGRQIHATRDLVAKTTHKIESAQRQVATALHLTAIPGVGVLTARAITATTPDVSHFDSARDDAASVGMAPKQTSSGGRERIRTPRRAPNDQIASNGSDLIHADFIKMRSIASANGRREHGATRQTPDPNLSLPSSDHPSGGHRHHAVNDFDHQRGLSPRRSPLDAAVFC